MRKNIGRRDFIKNAAVAGLAAAMPAATAGAAQTQPTENTEAEHIPNLRYRPDGKFKILQFTDTHVIYGDPKSKRALDNVNEMLDTEKPDLVIHTGDVIFEAPAEKALHYILDPICQRGIPFAVALGNHDAEYDLNRGEVMDVIRTLPGNLNMNVPDIYGYSNSILTLSSADGKTMQRVLYLFDSNRSGTIMDIKKTYGHIHFDQIEWYRNHSMEFTRQNGGTPVPSYAFFHIPIPEFKDGLLHDERRVLKGNIGEGVACPKINSGLFVTMKEQQDVQAIFVGHDHNNDYAMLWNGTFFLYGRFSGCDTVYNDLKPNGARVIELTEGTPGFRSWVRLYGGAIEQNLRYPEDFHRI